MKIVPPAWIGLDLVTTRFAAEAERSEQQVRPAPSVAICDVLSFPQRFLADLALATTLLASTHGGGPLVLTTSRAAFAAALQAQVPVFVGQELSALAWAAENDRAAPSALEGWCAEKRKEPGWRLTPQLAVDVSHPEPEQGWSVERVLRAYGARLEAVTTGQEVPW